MKKLSGWFAVLWVAVFVSIARGAEDASSQEKPAPPPLPAVLLPCLQNPTQTGMTICFYTQNAAHVRVVWGEAEGNQMQEAPAVAAVIPHSPWTIWKVRLDGLKPRTRYQYHVAYQFAGKPEVVTDTYRFTPLPDAKDPVRFAMFNDVHNHRETLEALMSHVKPEDYDFSLLLGDMWTDPSQWQDADKVFRSLKDYIELLNASEKPLVFVRGNHETRGSFKNYMGYLFDLPNLDPTKELADQRWNFTLHAGPIWFVALDTGEDDDDITPDDNYRKPKLWQAYRKTQAAWLQNLVREHAYGDAPWRVIVTHIPLYNNIRWYSPSSLRDWDPALREAKMDLELAGHDHSWKQLAKDKPYTFKIPTLDKQEETITLTPPWPVVIGGGPAMSEGTVGLAIVDATKLNIRLLSSKDGRELTRLSLEKSATRTPHSGVSR